MRLCFGIRRVSGEETLSHAVLTVCPHEVDALKRNDEAAWRELREKLQTISPAPAQSHEGCATECTHGQKDPHRMVIAYAEDVHPDLPEPRRKPIKAARS